MTQEPNIGGMKFTANELEVLTGMKMSLLRVWRNRNVLPDRESKRGHAVFSAADVAEIIVISELAKQDTPLEQAKDWARWTRPGFEKATWREDFDPSLPTSEVNNCYYLVLIGDSFQFISKKADLLGTMHRSGDVCFKIVDLTQVIKRVRTGVEKLIAQRLGQV